MLFVASLIKRKVCPPVFEFTNLKYLPVPPTRPSIVRLSAPFILKSGAATLPDKFFTEALEDTMVIV